LLLPADAVLAGPVSASLRPGDRVDTFEIVRLVYLVADTEVYLARGPDHSPTAVKLARTTADAKVGIAIEREAEVLDLLDGTVSPRLLCSGDHGGEPYLAMSWCGGVDAHHAARQARDAHERLALAEHVIDAYARLHEQGVLHGDVHPRNLLVGPEGAVTIVDYGLAAITTERRTPHALRGGIDFYLEPEAALARLAGTASPLTPPGEQYSLGALVFLLLTGGHTHEFSLVPEEMLRQLAEQPPLSFKEYGLRGLPSVERALSRALAREPGSRYESVGQFLRAFQAAVARDRPVATRPTVRRHLLEEVLARVRVPGELFSAGLPAPAASAVNGAAGVAYALLRLARAGGDADLLAQADLWSEQAVAACAVPERCWNAELGLTPDTVGAHSFHHQAPGVHAVQALIAHARGDDRAQRLAAYQFVQACQGYGRQLDVAFGRAGLLLGCALLLDVEQDRSLLTPLGEELLRLNTSQVETSPTLGAAHGRAGMLFAILRWCEAAGAPVPERTEAALAKLGALAIPSGRGLYWPLRLDRGTPDAGLAASWCNGSAGYVPLWTLAHRLLDDERYLRLAAGAAWAAWETPSDAPHLCCGLAGRAYALLTLHHHTCEERWRTRAGELAARAAAAPRSPLPDSLYHGQVGVALLTAEVEEPCIAGMPLFNGEGWPTRS
jgi:serine/threonine-protein kinase